MNFQNNKVRGEVRVGATSALYKALEIAPNHTQPNGDVFSGSPLTDGKIRGDQFFASPLINIGQGRCYYREGRFYGFYDVKLLGATKNRLRRWIISRELLNNKIKLGNRRGLKDLKDFIPAYMIYMIFKGEKYGNL